ncbi:MAG TPA: hypothetical protein VGF99_13440 [Myxococcota bacterium]
MSLAAPRITARADADDVTACYEIGVVVDNAVAPRVAVRAPAGQALDVVNVESGAAVDDNRREVVFIVEAARVDAPWVMTVIVNVGGVEERFVGPTIEAANSTA